VVVLSVNVGLPRELVWKRQRVSTAIFKAPVEGAIPVRKLNLDGDRQADLIVHGGPDKAVYAYPAEHYAHWRMKVPETPETWGAFGENLTTRGVLETDLNIGDHVRIGSALLQVSQPRMPCYKLQVRFDRDDMTRLFAMSRRSGLYFSVIEEGEVQAGDEIKLVKHDEHGVSVADVNGLYFDRNIDRELVKRALEVPALTAESRSMVLSRLGQEVSPRA
jgi:MOSC domain-containing protein YiiM